MAPATLTATGLSFSRATRLVVADVSVTVAPGDRIGVVGANGVGKSTLLRLLAGSLTADAGRVTLAPPTATVGYLAQERLAHADGDETVRALLARSVGVAGAEAELAAAAVALGGGGPGADDRYAAALERFDALGAADFEARAEAVLVDELGLDPGVADAPVGALSGGQAARVALAAVTLSRFDVTLLDEPTNDLDFDGIALVERFVESRPGGVVVVSHDRAFLDATVTTVLELDEHDSGGRLYGGGWSAYAEERATARRHAETAYAEYTARRDDLRWRARREREWATSGVSRARRRPSDNDKAQRDFRINRTEQLASRARRTERAAARLVEVDKPWEGWNLAFTIGAAPRAGAVVARLEGAVIERGSFRLGPLDLQVDWGDRIALLGPNGAGKSSLLLALLGWRPLAAGGRVIGPSVVVGELGQDRRAFAGERSVLRDVLERCPMPDAEARSLLAKFGLGAEHVGRAGVSLSPGERTRAELATFQGRGVNFLVLDEPTNHLDLPAIEQLEGALAAFGGTLLLVSHDRRLLDTVAVTRTITLDRAGAVHEQVV